MPLEDKHKELFINLMDRVQRAMDIGSDLDRDIRLWNNKHPLGVDFVVKPDGMGWSVVIAKLNPVPDLEGWGLRYGEVAHHLRSVLNTMLTKIAKADGLSTGKELQFPIVTEQKNWNGKNAKNAKSGERRRVAAFPERLQRLIYGYQPFTIAKVSGGDPRMDVLAVLAWTNNQDKHHIELAAVPAPQSVRHMCDPHFKKVVDNFNGVEPRFTQDNSFEVGSVFIDADTTPHEVAYIKSASLDIEMDMGFEDEEGNVTHVRVAMMEMAEKVRSIIETVIVVWADPEFDLDTISGSSDFKQGAAFGKAGVDAVNGEGTWDKDFVRSPRQAVLRRELSDELALAQRTTEPYTGKLSKPQ